ncbi:MAG: type II secretion system F family protein [Anaerolineae bacterium]|nr:type II secretion system F family protein [Anaerolineae bacterium]MCZ2112714.1 type II secretion system F family protein [Anaerolineae bacterium]
MRLADELELKFARFMFKADSGGRRRLYRKLAKLIGNGVQLLGAIESIRDRRVVAGGKSHPETIALTAWAAQIQNGKSIADAMAGWVAPEEQMLISAGEKSGEMEAALLSTARTMEARTKINGALIGGLAYPIVLALLAFGVLYMFGFKIVPAFSQVVKDVNAWRGTARVMVEVSMFAKSWLWLMAVLAVAVVIAFFVSLRYWDGPMRVKVDRYAPYSIYRIILGSTWLIALAALVEAGMKIETALEQLAENSPPWLETRIKGALAGMRSGFNLGDSLARAGHQFPDQEIIDDLGVYASLSGFDAALQILGREWLEEAVAQIQARMRVVFGFSILSVGVLIAFMVGGMMDMQLQMSKVMQHSMR